MSHPAEPTIEMPFELESLAKAVNYQRWVSDAIQPYMGRRILEVGAGVGTMSQWLPVMHGAWRPSPYGELVLNSGDDRAQR